MFRRLPLVALFVLAVASSVGAQSLPCIRFPYQAQAGADFSAMPGNQHQPISISVPASPFEIEQITVRLHSVGGALNLYALTAATTLTGQSITHGVEMGSVLTSGAADASLSRLVKLYADPNSKVTFDTDVYIGGGTGRMDVTLVGRLVTPGCWIGPQ